MKPLLLIVDDDEGIRSQMKWALTSSYEVVTAEDRVSAVEVFRQKQPRVVLLDLGLPPHPGDTTEGMATLKDLLALESLAKIIIVSGQGERQNAMRAVVEGAYDFLCKPVDLDELKMLLRRCFYVADLEVEYRDIQQRFREDTFEGMLGTSPKMQDVFATIRKVATSDAPVLILGESGTGKEMAGRAIHRLSPRVKGPFVAINCGAIPENLLESELFGHEKGAFTGAHAQRMGRVEMAAEGSLFLDEIGELPVALQVKLLRFLQERQVERVGGRKQIEVDTRVIAATNSDLRQAMAEGRFREDLFYRLAVVVVKLPALREREGDVPLLAKGFLKRFGGQAGKPSLTFDPQAIRAVEAYAWPGNVRELENRVKRAVIMADGVRITASDLELMSADSEANPTTTLREAREKLERDMITRALHRHGGKIAPAATELGVSRPTLYELMDKLGIRRD